MSTMRSSPVCELLELRNLLAANLVADIGTLGRGSDPGLVGSFNNEVYMVATTPDGLQILATDGTERGTRQLLDADLRCEPRCTRGALPTITTSVGGLFLRAEYDAARRQSVAIWKTPANAGESPTKLVTLDERQDPEEFRLARSVEFDGRAYLLVRFGLKGILASTDGSPQGSRIEDTFDFPVTDMAVVGNRFFVVGVGRPMAKLAGENEFRRLDTNLRPRTVFSIGDRAIATNEDGRVWAVDVENSHTRLLSSGTAGRQIANESSFYFQTHRSGEIWRSDGTQDGTKRLSFNLVLQDLVATDDGAYFAIEGDTTTIWRAEGANPLQEVVDLDAKGQVTNMAWSAGRLHFSVDGEYWTSDGTQNGTRPLGVVLHPGGVHELADGRVLFVGSRDGSNTEPWVSDGSVTGTKQVMDLQPGTHSADFVYPKFSFEGGRLFWRRRDFVAFQGTVYFGAEDALYRSDGTSQGTQKYFTTSEPRSILEPSKTRSRVDEIQVVGNQLFFFVNTLDPKPRRARTEIQLWVTDGHSELTLIWSTLSKVHELKTPVDAFSVEDQLYFRLNIEDEATELWTSDGTQEGTSRLVSTPVPYADFAIRNDMIVYWEEDQLVAVRQDSDEKRSLADGVPSNLYTVGDHVLFIDRANRIWTTNGTDEARSYFRLAGEIEQTLVVGDLLYVLVEDGQDDEVWRTDGTHEGTYKIPSGRRIRRLHNVDGRLYFWQQRSGTTLFSSDGSQDGTKVVTELPRSIDVSSCCLRAPLVRAGDDLFFVAENDEFGRELWKLDETSGSAPVVIDTNPGRQNGMPEQIVALGTDIFFSAFFESLGRELWRYTPDDERTADFDGNGSVDFDDFIILTRNFGKLESADVEEGDTDRDGDVDFEDFLYLSSQFATRNEQ